jgi:hypothetical protein
MGTSTCRRVVAATATMASFRCTTVPGTACRSGPETPSLRCSAHPRPSGLRGALALHAIWLLVRGSQHSLCSRRGIRQLRQFGKLHTRSLGGAGKAESGRRPMAAGLGPIKGNLVRLGRRLAAPEAVAQKTEAAIESLTADQRRSPADDRKPAKETPSDLTPQRRHGISSVRSRPAPVDLQLDYTLTNGLGLYQPENISDYGFPPLRRGCAT